MMDIQCARKEMLFGLAVLLVACLVGQKSFADENDQVRDAFDKNRKRFVWYDSEHDSIRPANVEPGEPAASRDRNDIPEGEIDEPTNPNTPSVSQAANTNFSNIVLFSLITLLTLAIIALIVWAFMRFGNKTNEEKAPEKRVEFSPGRIEELPFDFLGSSAKGDLLSLARQAYAANDFARATIYLYSHVLLSLDHFGWLRLARGKTNRQYLKELAFDHKMRSYFEGLMIGFEQAFFGKYVLSKDQIDSSWTRIDEFQRDVKQLSKPATT